jgi:hypothetical protein
VCPSMIYSRKTIFASTLLVVVACMLTTSITFAFQNEPADFRGMKWKSSVSQSSDMQFIAEDGELKFYEKKNENLKIGDALLDKIVYGFYRDQFYSVIIYYSSLPVYSKLKEIFIQQFGEPYQPNKFVNKYFWYGDDVDILLTFDDVLKKGRISYFYKPIVDTMEADDKLKAKQGAADL